MNCGRWVQIKASFKTSLANVVKPYVYWKYKKAGVSACDSSCMGGWGRRIPWTNEAEVAVIWVPLYSRWGNSKTRCWEVEVFYIRRFNSKFTGLWVMCEVREWENYRNTRKEEGILKGGRVTMKGCFKYIGLYKCTFSCVDNHGIKF